MVYQDSISGCDSVLYKGKTYYQSVIYQDTVNDTIFVFNASVHHSSIINMDSTSCRAIKIGDSIINASGYYNLTLSTIYDCDSIINLNFIMNGPSNEVKLENGTTYISLADSAQYQWYRCNPWMEIPNKTQKTFTTFTNGSYAVVVNNDICSDTSKCIELYSSGIQLSKPQNNLIVYPNPTSNNVTITSSRSSIISKIDFYNSLGQQIVIKFSKIDKGYRLDVSHLPTGIYYLSIKDREGEVLKKGKIVIQR